MGMNLHGQSGDFRFNITSWRYVLKLAHQYGWEPAGTKMPQYTVYDEDDVADLEMTRQRREIEEHWDGCYFTNDGQLVTEEDAENIARALEQALAHIPDEDAVGIKAATTEYYDGEGGRLKGVGLGMLKHLTATDWFSGAGKQSVRDFIAYCRSGGFTIW